MKIFSYILVLFLSFSIIACSKSEPETSTSTSTSEQPTQTAVSSDEAIAASLEGSRWKMEYKHNGAYNTYDFTLEPAGILRRHTSHANMSDNWKVTNGRVIINLNDGKVIYTSNPIKAGAKALFGTSLNFRNESWEWRAVKRKEVILITK